MSVDLTRSREFSRQFIEWIHDKGRVLIVTHDNPDPDSLAAAMALKHLIQIKTGQDAVIAFGGVIGRGENRVMVQKLDIEAVPLDRLDLDAFSVVCMVDTQPAAGNNSYPAERQVHLVIDHHPLCELTSDCRWVDVREDYGAAATILFEYLLANEIALGNKLATILFYALKSETQDLGREWSKADREAYLHLFPLSNNRILFDITHPEVPRQYFQSYCKAIQNARMYDDVLVFNLYSIDNPDMVAEVADFLLRVDEIKIVMGMGRFDDKEILSFRTLCNDIHAGSIMCAVVKELGTAGGHGMIAGGQICPMRGNGSVQLELENTLTRRLMETLGRKLVRAKRLVAENP